MGVEKPITRPAEPTRHRITVAEFVALDGAGFFDDVHVELIDGEIFEMAPLHRPHAKVQWELTVAVGLAVRDLPGIEGLAPISAELGEHSLSEADIVVARVGGGDRSTTTPFVLLMIEVADSSLHHDLGAKLRLDARTGVPEYWVADVNGREIIRFYRPAGEQYAERTVFPFGQPIPSATIEGLTVDTSRLAA